MDAKSRESAKSSSDSTSLSFLNKAEILGAAGHTSFWVNL